MVPVVILRRSSPGRFVNSCAVTETGQRPPAAPIATSLNHVLPPVAATYPNAPVMAPTPRGHTHPTTAVPTAPMPMMSIVPADLYDRELCGRAGRHDGCQCGRCDSGLRRSGTGKCHEYGRNGRANCCSDYHLSLHARQCNDKHRGASEVPIKPRMLVIKRDWLCYSSEIVPSTTWCRPI